MSEIFKVGDKVVRKPRKDNSVFEMYQGSFDYYTITSISKGGWWLQLDNFTDNGKDPHPWYAINFELYQEPGDDGLPPVPRSVSYLKENGHRKLVACINGSLVNVLLSLSYRGSTDAVSYSMEPDAALQLAHDIRRMAMEIKRKGKAQ